MRKIKITIFIIIISIATTAFAKDGYVKSSSFSVFAEHYTMYNTIDYSNKMDFSFAFNGKNVKCLWDSRNFMYNFTLDDIDMFIMSTKKYEKWSEMAIKDKDVFVKDISKSGEFSTSFKSTGSETFLYIKMQGRSEKDYYTWRIDSNQFDSFKKSLIELREISKKTTKIKEKYN